MSLIKFHHTIPTTESKYSNSNTARCINNNDNTEPIVYFFITVSLGGHNPCKEWHCC